MSSPEVKIIPEDMPLPSNRPTAPDTRHVQELQEKSALGEIVVSDWEEDFLDSLLMCVEEDRQWTTKQAEKFDELQEKFLDT